MHSGRPCFIPQAQKVGRKKGSRGRYQGVDKALRNLQVALKQADGQTPMGKSNIIDNISGILNDEAPPIACSSLQATPPPPTPALTASSCNVSDWTSHASKVAGMSFVLQNNDQSNTEDEPTRPKFSHSQRNMKSNPLWLIADSSREALTTMAPTHPSGSLRAGECSDLSEDAQSCLENISNKSIYLLNSSACIPIGLNLDSRILEEGLDAVFTAPRELSATLEYFKYRDINLFPDTGPEFDPIEQGLVSTEEAQSLFTRSASQPLIHETAAYILAATSYESIQSAVFLIQNFTLLISFDLAQLSY